MVHGRPSAGTEETKLGDVYSLGCVLWEMLAGSGSHLLGRRATAQDARVPVGLRTVVERCVSERPRERFQSAGALARAARSALAPVAVIERTRRKESPAFHDALSAGLSAGVLVLCSETLPAAADRRDRRR